MTPDKLKHESPRIKQLSLLVANQIAAGEVIERPASVVKELLENALDAHANAITVEIGFGGLNQIKVSDNGVGIVSDDLPLAIAAHATSKIRELNDLYAMTSMGFRGEALASIAAISKLSLSSKTASQEHAMMLRVDGERSTPTLSPCARAQGTTVDVVDLFFNAPVRKTFLKSARSEFQAIEVIVKRFALSAPHVALILQHNGRQIFSLPAVTCEKSRRTRVAKLLGKPFLEHAVYLDATVEGVRLEGWISGEAYQRSQNDKQWVYINQRMVKDKLMTHAIKKAYEERLYPGRYPSCLLYLTIPPNEVDVNVHPTKHEVRFQQPRFVHDFIYAHLSRALGEADMNQKDPLLAKPQTPVGCQKGYIKKPALVFSSFAERHSNHLTVLNESFGLAFLDEKPFIVDMERVEHHRLLHSFHQHKGPLVPRPLLVPIKFEINKAQEEGLQSYKAMLDRIGIQLEGSKDGWLVRTIPLTFPQLDIKKFIHGFLFRMESGGIKFTHSNLFEQLLECQPFDGSQLTEASKALLMDHLSQFLATSRMLQSACVRLDVEKCRELLGMQYDG